VLRIRPALDLASLQLDWLPALDTARRLGVDTVEIDLRRQLPWRELGQTAIREILKQLSDRKVRVSVVRFRTKKGYDEAQDLDRRIEGTKTAMGIAAALRASFLTNRLGRCPAPPQTAASEAQNQNPLIVEALRDLIRHAERQGVLLTAELGEDSGSDLQTLLNQLPDGGLGVDLDPGLLTVFGHSPRHAVQTVGRAVMVVHATDATLGGGAANRQIVPLGSGDVDYSEILGALEQTGYSGHFFVRAAGKSRPIADVQQAVEYLRRI